MLEGKKLSDDDRKYMVLILATVLQTYIQRPSMKQCEVVAKSLVRQYPFLKEDVSHSDAFKGVFTLYQPLDWTTGLDYWTGLLDSPLTSKMNISQTARVWEIGKLCPCDL